MKRRLEKREDMYVCLTVTDIGYFVEVVNGSCAMRSYTMVHDDYTEALAHFEMFDPTQLEA